MSNVTRPAHYTQTNIEAIDYLEDSLGEGFEYFLEGNVKKYMHRWRYKNGVEDLRKARWYLNRLIDHIEIEVEPMNVAYEYYSDHQKLPQTPLDMVRQFANIMGQQLDEDWLDHTPAEDLTGETSDLEQMRMQLIVEEAHEVLKATQAAELLKELADLVYVTYGYAATFGWDLDEAVRRVHASNMSKLGDNGQPIFRADGKVAKGPNYQKPDLTDLV